MGYKQDAASGAAGVGVRSGNLPDFDGGGQGEIDPGQALAIIFSQPVYLTSFTVNFLYNEFTPNPNIIEGGQYALLFPFAVGPFPFSQTNPLELFSGVGTEPGSLVVSTFHGLPIAGIVFYSSGTTQHDYVVRSIDASSTPEPGSMLLLGSGLLGLVGLRRRMRRK